MRRTNLGQNTNEPNSLDVLDPARYSILPNTGDCYHAKDPLRTLPLARELRDGHIPVKLEALGDPVTRYPNVNETFEAARILVAEGF